MIGNDIIDLTLAQQESNWKRTGFVEKIFTPSEQVLISTANKPEIMVWYLWSLKEAVYKIYNRQTLIRAFMPLELECFDITMKNKKNYGKVRCLNTIYYTQTAITTESIDTVAVLNSKDFERIKTLDNTVSVKKTNGIPNYYCSDSLSFKPFSKSHHGRFQRIVALMD
ncbi:4'-phosphopantetheinyl transferase superfamily protein [Flavobacterium sp.]|uniref:4'-phosphopantetheinyl transferase family protein n=1 Tax=Flavobacterium sp. TaxID=239 RepID=UPI0025F180C7|nr:4'-phosphopantetheinyl transferase superfamily protein [Flavobacterium sp.]